MRKHIWHVGDGCRVPVPNRLVESMCILTNARHVDLNCRFQFPNRLIESMGVPMTALSFPRRAGRCVHSVLLGKFYRTVVKAHDFYQRDRLLSAPYTVDRPLSESYTALLNIEKPLIVTNLLKNIL